MVVAFIDSNFHRYLENLISYNLIAKHFPLIKGSLIILYLARVE